MDRVGKDTSLFASGGSNTRSGMPRVRIGACEVEADLDRLLTPEGQIALEPKTMAVLMHLVEHAGKVVSTSELIDTVWLGRPMGDNPVYRCISKLRRALGDNPKAPAYIATVPTKGYRLVAPVAWLDADVSPLPTAETTQAPEDRPPLLVMPTLPPTRRHGFAWRLIPLLLTTSLLTSSWRRAPVTVPTVAPLGSPTLAVLPLQALTRGGDGVLLAQSVTDLLRHDLARLRGLTLVAGSPTASLSDPDADLRSTGRRLHARYVLRGNVAEVGERLRVGVQLVDAQSGAVLLSQALEKPLTDLAAVQDDVQLHVAAALHLAGSAVSASPVRLPAYEVYMRGRQLLAGADLSDAAQAAEFFRRATILDPTFARAYLGMGQALMQQADVASQPEVGIRQEATSALDYALQLDPSLGEAWVELAQLSPDPVRADALYRKGLALAPNDGPGYARYADFLFANARVGEAMEAIEQARRIEPSAPELYLRQAFFVMVVRSDVAEHDRLVREALRINPRLPMALYQLAYSKWEYSGEFAQAAQLITRAIAIDPQWLDARLLARDIYLDLGDPAAAAAALGPSAPARATTELAQYQGDRASAAAALKNLAPADWPDNGPQASKAQAVRDAAVASGNFAPAVRLLRSVQAVHDGKLPMGYRGYALVYAHTLVLAGQVARGRQLAQSTLALLETHSIGRAPHWFSRERAAAFAVLGDDERVLQELAHSVENGQLYRWWYLARRDPLYEHLRTNPRFKALNRLAMAHRERQRALLEAMRRDRASAQ